MNKRKQYPQYYMSQKNPQNETNFEIIRNNNKFK